MAIISTSVDRLGVVADLFGSFHAAQDACSELKSKEYPEESIFQFVELTAHDDLEARDAMWKDLGLHLRERKYFKAALADGKILVCVDSLDETKVERVAKIFLQSGSLNYTPETAKKTPVPKKSTKVAKAPVRKRAGAKVQAGVEVKVGVGEKAEG